jgi:hypothetical protein
VYVLGKSSITTNNSSFDLLYVWCYTFENVCDLNAEKWPNYEMSKTFWVMKLDL